MKTFSQLFLAAVIGACVATIAIAILLPNSLSTLKGSTVINPYAYKTGITEASTTVGTTPVIVIAYGSYSSWATVSNQSSTVAWCWKTATTTGVNSSAGQPLTQYGSYQFDQTDPYYGGLVCVTQSGTTTLSVSKY